MRKIIFAFVLLLFSFSANATEFNPELSKTVVSVQLESQANSEILVFSSINDFNSFIQKNRVKDCTISVTIDDNGNSITGTFTASDCETAARAAEIFIASTI